jgi:hypothetical protein
VLVMPTGLFSTDFADWRDYIVTVYQFASFDKYGAPSYGTGVSTACYIEMSPKLIRNSTGQEVVSSARIYIVGDGTVTPLDKVVLPDSSSPPILKVDHFYNDKATLELSVINV